MPRRTWMLPQRVSPLGLSLLTLILPAGTPFSYAQTAIRGAGATFPAPVYSLWLKSYQALHSNVQIGYDAIGSGGGIRRMFEGGADFGATDGPMSDQQLQSFKDTHGFELLHFATVLGAAVPAYNVPGNSELNFTSDILAGIYLGKITKWDDPLLREANPKAKLPSSAIIVIHRSDGSGTSYVWSDYLSTVNEIWKKQVGRGFSINWPAGLAARGNDGISEMIARTPDSLGYVELSYALQKHLAYGRVRNSSGNFINADLASVGAAGAEAGMGGSDDFRFSITNPAGKEAYPIASFSWLLVPAKIPDAAKKQALMDFLKWALTDGQSLAQQLVYARIPQAVASRELGALSRIQ